VDTTKTSPLTTQQIDELFKLSGLRWIYWLAGSFAVPFCIVAVLAVIGMYTILENSVPPFPMVIAASLFYGLLAGVLGLVAVGTSLLARRYWFLLASFTVPMLMIGGFWGSWGWLKHSDDLARDTYQQTNSLSIGQQILEWASYVAGGCKELGLMAGLIVACIACTAYFLGRRQSTQSTQ
jgi:hypothetical protein